MPHPGEEERTAILPQLSVRRGRAAVEFYKVAFGAVEDYRVGGTDEAEAVVAQLSVGPASFWVSDESPPNLHFSPESLGGGTTRMLLTVPDPDAAVERALAAGASEVNRGRKCPRLAPGPHRGPIRPPLGDRQTARDLAAG